MRRAHGLALGMLATLALASTPPRSGAQAPARQEVFIPDENAASRTEPSARPPVGDATERAARLFDAILRDDPELARDFFFPLEAFLVLKGIADPGRYWNVLWSHYERDIHALHAEVPAGSTFDRFVLARRGGWVARREEANALPYWASRHSFIHYRAPNEDRERRFEVRTLINWGPRWYITHLR